MSPNQHKIDLNKYIQDDYIRSLFMESFCYIDDENKVDDVLKGLVTNASHQRIIFAKSYLKTIFFEMVKYYSDSDVSVINCNSNVEIFMKDLSECNSIVIYNNINKCRDAAIIELIKKYPGILVC